MDRIEHAFAALSQRMNSLPAPAQQMPAPLPLSCLIDRVNAAKRGYERPVPR